MDEGDVLLPETTREFFNFLREEIPQDLTVVRQLEKIIIDAIRAERRDQYV